MSSIKVDASDQELKSSPRNDNNSSHFIRKCSMFDKKFGKKLMDSIVEVAEGFENDSNIDNLNEKQPKQKQAQKLGFSNLHKKSQNFTSLT
jgi:hypothetical protein